ncbi:MAG: amidase [Pseudomonadota bacterium]
MTSQLPSDLGMASAADLVKSYAEGSVSPVEATQAALAAIARHDETLNAFVGVDEEGALAAAKEAEERWRLGVPKGRIDGVPTSIKDIVDLKGWRTAKGSKTLADAPLARQDAPCSARLREHGAVILGKTTTPEFGWKGVTDSPLTGVTRNPWDPGKTPGGSSGGASAAVAAGMGALAIGTDGGGSVRIPAAFTGIFGIKPSFGRVPAFPLSPFGTVAHIGPMTRTVTDGALMLNVIAEPDPRDWYALPKEAADFTAGLDDGVSGLKIAFSPTLGGHPVDPEVAALVKAAALKFADLGATLEEAEPTLRDVEQVFRTLWFAGAANLSQNFTEAQKSALDPGFRDIAAAGSAYGLMDYLDAVAKREAMGTTMNLFHQDYDLLLTPALPIPAFAAGEEYPRDQDNDRWVNWTPFTYPFNLTQQPAASVPCGLTSAGLPVGFQIVGPSYGDRLVLQAARAYEIDQPFQMPSSRFD